MVEKFRPEVGKLTSGAWLVSNVSVVLRPHLKLSETDRIKLIFRRVSRLACDAPTVQVDDPKEA
ncbi:MAG: hypothetical protein AAFR42_05775, partial [Cyanobacteria bacterium J06628_6]